MVLMMMYIYHMEQRVLNTYFRDKQFVTRSEVWGQVKTSHLNMSWFLRCHAMSGQEVHSVSAWSTGKDNNLRDRDQRLNPFPSEWTVLSGQLVCQRGTKITDIYIKMDRPHIPRVYSFHQIQFTGKIIHLDSSLLLTVTPWDVGQNKNGMTICNS